MRSVDFHTGRTRIPVQDHQPRRDWFLVQSLKNNCQWDTPRNRVQNSIHPGREIEGPQKPWKKEEQTEAWTCKGTTKLVERLWKLRGRCLLAENNCVTLATFPFTLLMARFQLRFPVFRYVCRRSRKVSSLTTKFPPSSIPLGDGTRTKDVRRTRTGVRQGRRVIVCATDHYPAGPAVGYSVLAWTKINHSGQARAISATITPADDNSRHVPGR